MSNEQEQIICKCGHKRIDHLTPNSCAGFDRVMDPECPCDQFRPASEAKRNQTTDTRSKKLPFDDAASNDAAGLDVPDWQRRTLELLESRQGERIVITLPSSRGCSRELLELWRKIHSWS